MANKLKFWTAEEDAVLMKNVSECKTHTEAFKKTSEELGRSLGGVEQRFYLISKRSIPKHQLLLHKKQGKGNTSSRQSSFSRIISSIRNLFK